MYSHVILEAVTYATFGVLMDIKRTGAPRTKLSKESADACVIGFVFVSCAYLRSPICRMELDILRKVRFQSNLACPVIGSVNLLYCTHTTSNTFRRDPPHVKHHVFTCGKTNGIHVRM